MSTPGEFMGYPRNTGSAGIRNHLLVLPTVICANRVAQLIGQAVPGAIALQHPFGCSQIGNDVTQTLRTLAGMGANANVGGVIIVGLGCETISADELANSMACTGKPVKLLKIQELGGSDHTFKVGTDLARQLSRKLSQVKRRPCSLSQLTIGIHCADPDDSVLTWANPVAGRLSDFLITNRGRVVLSEVPELVEAKEELQAKAETPSIAKEINQILLQWQQRLSQGDHRIWHLPPGDSPALPTRSISLGSLSKAGREPIREVLAYGQRPREAGLVLMNSPSTPAESLTGMVAGGAQLIVLTNGSGVPIGSPIAPVISISSNPRVLSSLGEHIDVALTSSQSSDSSLQDAAIQLLDMVRHVADGQRTMSEILGYRDFAINRIGPTV